jgi:SAM-dependent methyltransferase
MRNDSETLQIEAFINRLNNSIMTFSSAYDNFFYRIKQEVENFYRRDENGRVLNPEKTTQKEAKYISKGSYYFIPKHSGIAIRKLSIVHDYFIKNRQTFFHSFIDAGCGPGNIVVLARHMKFKAFGLELDEKVLKLTRERVCGKFLYPCEDFLDLPLITKKDRKYPIAKQNIVTFDKYHEFDVVYYYCPFRDEFIEKEFEKMVEDQMKVGAVLIACYKKSHRIQRDKRFIQIANKMSDLSSKEISIASDIFVKVKK